MVRLWGMLAIVLGLATFAPTPVLAFGAIAVDDVARAKDAKDGLILIVDAPSQAEAERQALAECKKAGNSHCRLMLWFETCGAYAASRSFFGVGTGPTVAEAERLAIQHCGNRNCTVVVSRCE
ncbi:DUF4189 domain-containing protein [uncultured Gammaproteobacteria bacterium]